MVLVDVGSLRISRRRGLRVGVELGGNIGALFSHERGDLGDTGEVIVTAIVPSLIHQLLSSIVVLPLVVISTGVCSPYSSRIAAALSNELIIPALENEQITAIAALDGRPLIRIAQRSQRSVRSNRGGRHAVAAVEANRILSAIDRERNDIGRAIHERRNRLPFGNLGHRRDGLDIRGVLIAVKALSGRNGRGVLHLTVRLAGRGNLLGINVGVDLRGLIAASARVIGDSGHGIGILVPSEASEGPVVAMEDGLDRNVLGAQREGAILSDGNAAGKDLPALEHVTICGIGGRGQRDRLTRDARGLISGSRAALSLTDRDVHVLGLDEEIELVGIRSA